MIQFEQLVSQTALQVKALIKKYPEYTVKVRENAGHTLEAGTISNKMEADLVQIYHNKKLIEVFYL